MEHHVISVTAKRRRLQHRLPIDGGMVRPI
jgi:hypothetical protein